MLFLRFNEIILRTFGPSVSVLALFFPGQLTYVNFFYFCHNWIFDRFSL
ncbi:hypothetical protein BCBMB205_03310 [Bacillus sp. CN2]|nr:hypothetical protein BCBMB205_03310 [Bacillus velezensis]ARZ56655.1 hypothetical protein BAGQ_0386 [Bacillus velezensis]GFR56271.1 hypothetical protein BCBMB205_03310 [Bacillus sp. CN2]